MEKISKTQMERNRKIWVDELVVVICSEILMHPEKCKIEVSITIHGEELNKCNRFLTVGTSSDRDTGIEVAIKEMADGKLEIILIRHDKTDDIISVINQVRDAVAAIAAVFFTDTMCCRGNGEGRKDHLDVREAFLSTPVEF